jgi:hypothetical protein
MINKREVNEWSTPAILLTNMWVQRSHQHQAAKKPLCLGRPYLSVICRCYRLPLTFRSR